jgi:succinate dehydrogenase (ubiquinone) membrane anchor subunit
MGYVPGGPIVRDTVNDALPVPAPHTPHGSYHWAFERLLSAALLPATTAAFVVSPTAYPTLDALLGVGLVMHSHIGVRVPFPLSRPMDRKLMKRPRRPV